MTVAAALERAVREDGPGVLATPIRHLGGDFALAANALQDACLLALTAWERGVPDVPAAGLTIAARRSALDRLRRARGLDERVRALEALAQRTGTASAPGAPTKPSTWTRAASPTTASGCCSPAAIRPSPCRHTLRSR